MVMQALCQLYGNLLDNGKLTTADVTRCTKKVSWILDLDFQGNLIEIRDCRIPDKKGKLHGIPMDVPSDGTVARKKPARCFCHGNAEYIFGRNIKDVSRGDERRNVTLKLHHDLLDSLNIPEAKAILLFLDQCSWEDFQDMRVYCDYRQENPDVLKNGDDVIVFSVHGRYVLEDQRFWQVWNEYTLHISSENTNDLNSSNCLITGKYAQNIARLHRDVRAGSKTGNSGGKKLSSFNDKTIEFFGKDRNFTAPVSYDAMVAYTSAWDYLVEHQQEIIDDFCILYWTQNVVDKYANLFASIFSDSYVDVADIVKNLVYGNPAMYDSSQLDPNETFYVLGYYVNTSRIVIQFFYRNSFGDLIQHVNAHYERSRLVSLSKPLSLRRICDVLENSKSSYTQMFVRQLTEAIVFGKRYPLEMLYRALQRISDPVEKEVKPEWIAVVKAYCLKNLSDDDKRKEEFTMSLNTESNNPAYLCGRLFAVYERIQWHASNKDSRKRKSSLKSNYFRSAMMSPSRVMPMLSSMMDVYLDKLHPGMQVIYQKIITEVKDRLSVVDGESPYPNQLLPIDQGLFDLGYYHQREILIEESQKNKGASENFENVDMTNEVEEE